MEADFQTQVAFYLTGKRPGAGLDAVEALDLRPALLANYRDLTSLRYDFPLVLVGNVNDRGLAQCLSAIVDGVVHETAQGDDAERMTKHLLQLEREMRVLVAQGGGGSLSTLWDKAANRLAARGDDLLKDSLSRARAALKIDGQVVDCSKTMPAELIKHAWAAVQDRKAGKFRETLVRQMQKLSDILQADRVRSKAGQSAASLKASIGAVHEDDFDFQALSRLLTKSSPKASLPESRRQRIESLLATLRSQRFFAAPGDAGEKPHSFTFDSCASALAAYRERMPKAIAVAKAVAMAELEIKGEYNEPKHDPFFKEFDSAGLDERDLAMFPDYLVLIGAEQLQGAENDKLAEILSAGLPVKILVQTDDLLETSPLGDTHLAIGLRSKQLANMAIGLNDIYVLQSGSSNLFQFRERILKGMNYSGPAVFSVFSGCGGKTGDLPPYLVAAAAMESRAFPAFTYDPSAGANWASRFYLEANSQVELDWPTHDFSYEDEAHQSVSESVAFTLIDFVACDHRYSRHFARLPREKWNDGLASVAEFVARETRGAPDKVPCILMVDRDNVLQKIVVDEKLVRAAQRCRETWHSVQELGGIHNSHAEQLLAREKKVWEEHERRELAARAPEAPAAQTPAAAPAATAAPAAAAASTEVEEKKSDDPYIETARCSTCNECTMINDKMFAYNENKQAYIKDARAGTYAQLVEAAESCQLGIIHPGKPLNPNEPGLAELIVRAEPFQ